jgi:Flp pilus assembly protein TadD
MKLDNPARALAMFEKAESVDNRAPAAKTGQGDALIALKRNELAKSAFEAARALAPTDTVIILKLAHVVALLGDKIKARQLLDEAIRLDKDHLPSDLVKKVTALLE